MGTLKPSFSCTCTTSGEPCREPREISFLSSLRTEEDSHSVECEGHLPSALKSSSGQLRNARADSLGWGVRRGDKDDRNDFSKLITAELMKTGNPGDPCWSKTFNDLSSKVWTRISLRLLIPISTRATRDGKWTIPMPPQGNR